MGGTRDRKLLTDWRWAAVEGDIGRMGVFVRISREILEGDRKVSSGRRSSETAVTNHGLRVPVVQNQTQVRRRWALGGQGSARGTSAERRPTSTAFWLLTLDSQHSTLNFQAARRAWGRGADHDRPCPALARRPFLVLILPEPVVHRGSTGRDARSASVPAAMSTERRLRDPFPTRTPSSWPFPSRTGSPHESLSARRRVAVLQLSDLQNGPSTQLRDLGGTAWDRKVDLWAASRCEDWCAVRVYSIRVASIRQGDLEILAICSWRMANGGRKCLGGKE